MPLLSPKFNSNFGVKKTSSSNTAQNRAFEESYEELKSKWATQPKFSDKYGVPKKSIRKSKIPSLRIPEDRNTRNIPSHVLPGDVVQKRSPMDPRELAKESPAIIEATLAKSRSIAPHFNKGGDQYVTPGIDIKTIGTKSKK